MKKKNILFIFLFILFCIISLQTNSYAGDLDKIEKYIVTVEPRMNDGTLDITYQITWKVLDSTTEGPLEWVQIGTPNSNFDNPTALTKNIESISKYNGSYVKIVFKKAYTAGEEFTFKYSIHQGSMHKKSLNDCKFEFTPAWFTGAKIDSMTIRWNNDQVKKSNADSTSDSYLVWRRTNMSKGEKLTVNITYDKTAFATLSNTNLTTYSQSSINNTFSSFKILVIFIIIYYILIFIISLFGGGSGGYYRHGGFSGGNYGRRSYYGGCVRSSCACASSCASSCACACAGSGRAGCSKKDFYGIKINMKKLQEKIKTSTIDKK